MELIIFVMIAFPLCAGLLWLADRYLIRGNPNWEP